MTKTGVPAHDSASATRPHGFRLTLSRKIAGALVAASIIASAAVGVSAYIVASDTARQHSVEVLEEGVKVRRIWLSDFVSAVEADLRFLAQAPGTAKALETFTMEFEIRSGLEGREEIQRAYIADNPHPAGQKHLLDMAATETGYDALHQKEHPALRDFLVSRGYYDIFLISAKGDIVYSVFKETDFATNLVEGAFADSGLGDAFRKVDALDSAAAYSFSDFTPYAPSHGAPAAFIAAPVFNHFGKRVGAVAFQLPTDRIAAAMASRNGVRTYLTGPDGVLRSDLPSTAENDALTARVNPVIAHLGDGKTEGHVTLADATGVLGDAVLVAETGVDFFGARFALVSEKALAAMEAPIVDLRNLLIAITTPIVLILGALALLIGYSISRPIRALGEAVTRLANNETVDIPGEARSDEVGDLARAMLAINDAATTTARAKAALDASSSPMMVADESFAIVYVNEATRDAFARIPAFLEKQGVTARRLEGASLDMFHDRPGEVRQRLQEDGSEHRMALTLDDRLFDLTVAPVRNASGDRIGYVAEWRDMTEQRQAEREINATIAAVAAGDFSRRPQVSTDNRFIAEAVGGLTRICDIVDGFVSDVDESVSALAEGDLGHAMSTAHEGRYGDVAGSVNAAIGKLAALVADIKGAEATMRGQISSVESGSTDLAGRAENQASSIEETAATMEEMSATISANAESASRASGLAGEARDRAVAGDSVVSQAVEAMGEIETSSEKITAIITVIDGIAFQTNLLALNAAVEAARAGDAGKGFAVVASEVRSLAQRSAEAAHDIKALITASSGKVSDGVRLVRATGDALVGIRDAIHRVTEGIEEISCASREQATGVSEISSALAHMDEMTQQNATLAEQSAASARSLAAEAERLGQLMRFFQVGDASDAAGSAAAASGAFPAAGARSEAAADDAWRSAARRSAAPESGMASGTAQAANSDWAEF